MYVWLTMPTMYVQDQQTRTQWPKKNLPWSTARKDKDEGKGIYSPWNKKGKNGGIESKRKNDNNGVREKSKEKGGSGENRMKMRAGTRQIFRTSGSLVWKLILLPFVLDQL